MKKVKKMLTMVCLISGLALPIGVQASTTSKADVSSTKSIMDVFPNLKKEQNAKGYTEVASTKGTYLKFTPKESTKESMKKDKMQSSQAKEGSKQKYTQDDFITTEVSESEYKAAETIQKLNTSKKGILQQSNIARYSYSEEDYDNSNSTGDAYLHLNVITYRNPSDRYKFLVRNEFVWLKSPTFYLTDAAGISVGDGMKIYANSGSGQIAHNYTKIDNSSPTGVSYMTEVRNATGMVQNTYGIGAKYDIWGGPQDFGYIQCEAGFTQYSGVHQSSLVYGTYAHARLAFSGSISLSSTGSISLGAGIMDKNYSVACDAAVN